MTVKPEPVRRLHKPAWVRFEPADTPKVIRYPTNKQPSNKLMGIVGPMAASGPRRRRCQDLGAVNPNSGPSQIIQAEHLGCRGLSLLVDDEPTMRAADNRLVAELKATLFCVILVPRPLLGSVLYETLETIEPRRQISDPATII